MMYRKNTLYIMCHNVKKIIIQWCTKNIMYIMCHNVKSTTILLWTDVIYYDYVNDVINVWGKKNNNMMMYKKDTVHNVTQYKKIWCTKQNVHNVTQCNKLCWKIKMRPWI